MQTSLHQSIKSTPYFLTRYPSFPNPNLQWHYGELDAAQWYQQLQHCCCQIEAQHNMDALARAKLDYNKTAWWHHFVQGQAVWLNEHNFLGRNWKLSPNWLGLYPIIKVFDNGVMKLQLPKHQYRAYQTLCHTGAPAAQTHRYDGGWQFIAGNPSGSTNTGTGAGTHPVTIWHPNSNMEEDNSFWQDKDPHWPEHAACMQHAFIACN